MLNSDFQQQVISVPPSPTSDAPPPRPPSSPARPTIFVNEDFDLFHLVLFFLYTDRICFVTSHEAFSSHETPTTHDAEGIYAISHRLMVDSLAEKALHFMQSTTNLGNITARTFGRFANAYKDVQKWYDDYFMKHWDEIRRGPAFEKFFVGLESDPEEYIRVNTKFRGMITGRD